MENTSDFEKQILAKIKEAREAKGLSKRKLAELADISSSAYNDYENGDRPFPFDRLLKVLEALELDIFSLGKTVEVETTTLQLVPIDGKQVEGYFQATLEAFQMIQEKAKEDSKEIKDLKREMEEIKELLRGKSNS